MVSKVAPLRWLVVSACALGVVPALAQTLPVGTAFTYQGRLTENGAPASGAYDFRFILMDAEAGGSQVGPILFRDDMMVTSGLFTVSLDFGGVFTGSKRFLEVAVRPGTSTGSYTPIGARQELTPAPYSLQAASTTTVAGLSCNSGQVLKWTAGAWSCGTDLAGSGTVTSVDTGAGLTGGPVTTTGTLSVANGGITSGMIADGAVGLAQIDQAQVQARVGASCPSGQYLRGINADGSVLCDLLPTPPTLITTVDDPAGGQVGWSTSLAIGDDGLPVIAYQDQTAMSLKVAHCGNAACTAGNTITTVDNPVGYVGFSPSIAIGADSFPVISYYDQAARALKVAKCVNAACTGVSTITTVDDPTNFVGLDSSIAIGTDGLPVISYFDSTADALKVAKCVNAACTGATSITTVDDPANAVGEHTSIAIGSDGLPVISYYDATAGALKVTHCGNATCTSGTTTTTVDDPANNVGSYTSIAIGSDGLPVISYSDATAHSLKVAHCGNATCSTGNTITTVDNPANMVGSYTSIAIGSDGFPVISYYDYSARALMVAKCVSVACTGASTITTVDDPANDVGAYTSIAIGADGLPVISYFDLTAYSLKVAHCGTRTCQ